MVSACLPVGLPVCALAQLKNHASKLHEILCKCYSWPWLGPPLTTMQYVEYFWFCVGRHVFTSRAMYTDLESATRRIIRRNTPEGVTEKSVLADRLVMAALRIRCEHYIFVPSLLHGVTLVPI